MRLMLAMAMMAGTAGAAPVVKQFSDGEFGYGGAAMWTTYVVVTLGTGATGSASTEEGGNGSPEGQRTSEVNLPILAGGGASAGLVLGQINDGFFWDPAVDGAADKMEFGFDLRALSSFGFGRIESLFFRPVVRQGGTVYRANTAILSERANLSEPGVLEWRTVSFLFDSITDWTRDGAAPDLSETGGPIQVGFEASLSGRCNAAVGSNCAASGVRTALDNFNVRITGVERQGPPVDTGEVPEPGTWAMLGGGLLGVAALRRRAK